jgi:aminoglycoside/choline kinase family phosphotransferase
MEHIDYRLQDKRKLALEAWLTREVGLAGHRLHAMPQDASLRRYFRVYTEPHTYVAMDAPPPENCQPFVAIARALAQRGLHTPAIVAEHISNGFLLLADLGDKTYLQSLQGNNADLLYGLALDALVQMHTCREVPGWSIPLFNEAWLWQEWQGFWVWFVKSFLHLPLGEKQKDLDTVFAQIVASVVSQPQVFMHRDFHSANLMVLPDNHVGILDFQDAFIGPLTYDAVSLLRDCYIAWPEEQVMQWSISYWQRLRENGSYQDISQQQFLQWFDWMGIQRHLKALLTYARKYIRDGERKYLQHIPRALAYLISVSKNYSELALLHEFLRTEVQPAATRAMLLCAP